MAARTFTFRMANEGGEALIADLRKLAVTSVEAERALRTLTQASPQLASVQDGVQAKMRQTAQAMQQVQTSAGGLGSALGRGGAIGVGIAAATAGFHALDAAIGGIPRAGDAALSSIARLTAAIGSDIRARSIFQDLGAISRQTGVAVTDSAASFQRFAIAAQSIGTTNAQVVQLVEGFQKFGIVAGASTEEVKSATVQLGQALASGKLQGDELRSVLETMPQLAQALAKELGTSIGSLREMGSEGKLTSEVVMPALLRAVQGINTEFEKMPVSMARAQQQFDVSAQSFLAHIDQALGLSQKLASILGVAAGSMDSIRQGLGGSTRAERQVQLGQEAAEIQERLRTLDQAAQPGISRQRNRGALVRPMVETRADLERQLEATRAEQRRINNEIVLQDEADFEIAQAGRLEAQRSASGEAIKKIRDDLDKSLKLKREHAEQVKAIDRALGIGAIEAAEAEKLKASAASDLAEALGKLEPKAKGAGGGLSDAARAATDAQKAFESAAKDARSIEAELDPVSAAMQRLETNLQRIRDAVGGGFISGGRGAALESSAYAKMAEDIGKIGREADNTSKEMDRFFSNMASKTEDAIIQWKGMGNVVRAVGEDIARVLLRQYVTNPLASAASSGAQGLFGWIGSLFSSPGYGVAIPGSSQPPLPFANGGVMTSAGSMPLHRYASGGVADRPQLALFGEGRRPEAFVPLPDGRTIPVTMRGGGMQPPAINVTINVANSNASAATIAAVARQAVAEEHARFVDRINRGGPDARIVGRRR